MKAKKIMFATDFSEHSEAARRFATSLARDSGATLLIVTVRQPPTGFTDTGFGGYTWDDAAEFKAMLEAVTPNDPNVPYAQRMLIGHPADEIVNCAEEEQVDLIVVGSHGHTGVMRFLLGSVAEAVVRHAKCPVLTVKRAQEVTQKVEA